MPNFRYRALTQNGEIVSGSISATDIAEVTQRIEYLGLVAIDTEVDSGSTGWSFSLPSLSSPRPEDVTVFTRDLALLLRAGARLNDALELLSNDMDVGRLRPVILKIKTAILSGESFAEALERTPALFSSMYVALVRVGEMSGTLDHILETLGSERTRAEALRRKVTDALQYPAFVLVAAGGVLIFFVTFVLPQFSAVLRDFNAKTDPVIEIFLALSDLLRGHGAEISLLASALAIGGYMAWRRPAFRAEVITQLGRLPIVSAVIEFHRTTLFCRNLGILLGSGVTLTSTLRILTDIMSVTGRTDVWTTMADRVRHGGKLSEALNASAVLPAVAVRMLRLGEETGQLPTLAARVAEFYEAKLQRQLDRIVGIIGPAAIVTISIVVGGLIVSVMTALLSVTQVVG
ncbi:type II secretion system F family protein [Bradyrhizobium sp. INPA01-394B]|uniref:Type II secretion system F family protein n=1 Tax=Bradyrhizobium campsiandrae TaxID=1729892 RepID=A0ABR7UB09_9BRAD|nr:type II secretion system F family protein [Bradyrhizobium campsiandrae]MBC9879629.1 type II secretion system F family protein [Bradyrhizobium campsiandrae]MBC9980766.1 type II secretion system F family protein [Bradyrhizobium campsiandrae]